MIIIGGQKMKLIVLVAGLLFCLANEVKGQKSFSMGHLFRQKCGIRTVGRSGRIVGGKDAYHGKWPWHVWVREIMQNGTMGPGMCGGALISSRHILTAAHCQPEHSSNSLFVILGEHDLTAVQDDLTPVLKFVDNIIIHPRFNTTTYENDLALLEIEPVTLRPHITPICLPHHHDGDFSGEMAFITGWGRLTFGGNESFSPILQETQVPIVTNEECRRMFFKAGYKVTIQKGVVCAGYSEGGRDSCQGDSGGPLMVKRDDGRWVLVGIVSYGMGCAEPNQPSIHTRVSVYRQWIDSHTQVKLLNNIFVKEE